MCTVFLLLIFSAGCDFIQLEVKQVVGPVGSVQIDYIDVGQGDAILVTAPDGVMLIDAGDNKTEMELVHYLQNKGITKIDYLIGTHPHADHIGGLDQVIVHFDIGKIYMPKVSHTSKTFESVLQAAKDKNYKISTGKAGETFSLGETVEVEILSPLREKYSGLNDYSIVIKMVNGQDVFLFMGDAEKLVEQDLLETYTNLKADVLKLGHHGSSTSTTEPFLKAVVPSIGIISAGEGNSYGHPHTEILTLLEDYNVEYYNTANLGTITIISNGDKTLEVITEK
jgi:DNA internalization-related competence protein ComEC/Rec2